MDFIRTSYFKTAHVGWAELASFRSTQNVW